MKGTLRYITTCIMACLLVCLNANAQYSTTDFNLKLNGELSEKFNMAAKEIYNPANFTLADSLLEIGKLSKDSNVVIAGMILKTFPYMAISDPVKGIETAMKVQEMTTNAKYRFAYFVCSQMEVIYRTMRNDYYGSLKKAQQMSTDAVYAHYIDGIHMGYYSMGIAFMLRNNPQVASTYFMQSANAMASRSVDDRFTWPTFLQLAKCHELMGEYEKAEVFAIKAEQAARRSGNTLVANRVNAVRLTTCFNLLTDQQYIKDVDKAKTTGGFYGYLTDEDKFIVESQYLARKKKKDLAIAVADSMGTSMEALANKESIYKYFGDIENAYKCRVKRDALNDSLLTAIQTEDIAAINGQMNNASLRILAEELDNQNQKIIHISITAIVILFLLFYIYSNINRRRTIARERDKLEEEVNRQTAELKALVTVINQKNSDITDSIRYAQRIQKAILPDFTQFIGKGINGAFTYFKPYNIVSGDFYWAHQKGNKLMIACSDCTGHGVPGGFMSMIGSTLLSDITESHADISASDVLKELDLQVINVLGQNNDEMLSDGMDLALIIYDTETKEMTCSSARRPIYIVHNNELKEIKGVKRSIGDRDELSSKIPFTDHKLHISEGDKIYLYTDGITDQFGGQHVHGEKGKRLSKTGITKILKDIHTLPMHEQKTAFANIFEQWQGTCNQTDDISLIGIQF
ncbi:MAG: SpoIIE family protein phosphatase [Bacteroidales bacterium]|nr:SpoIIE family protein phosphatase [Bacteroidales bacterium]